MGFTVEDMLIITREKYKMKLLAGRNGWANSISWLLMVEDTTITKNFKGKELVVTTGFGFDTTEKLLELVKILDEHHGSGLIINTGYYIKEIPKEVIDYADSCDLPLMTVPWDIIMSEMIKDLTVRIFFQSQTDEQISANFIKAIEQPHLENEYRQNLSSAFDVDGTFQVMVLKTPDLDSMDSMDRRRIGYRLQIYLENISHNAHFFYYDGSFLLILNAIDDASRDEIISGFLERAKRRLTDQKVYVGLGSLMTDVKNVHFSYERAVYAARMAMKEDRPFCEFDDLGLYRLLYSVSDKAVLREMGDDMLKPILDYDRKHQSDMLKTLLYYLKTNGSIQKVSELLHTHKNTILYRMNKIKELLGNDLEDGEARLTYYLAALLAVMDEENKGE